MLIIDSLKLQSNLILAPMAGVSDLFFRLLNRNFGCELAFTEMLNSRCVSYRSKKTQKMLSTVPEDRPLGVQLLGCETEFIQRALDVFNTYKFDILDFNAACPAKKVVRRGEGASLLKEPHKLHKILKLLIKNSRVPVTVKIRSGWDKNHINSREVALAAEDAGIKAVFIHGRTREQGYGGEVDYRAIREVKHALKVPVIASGNILSAALAGKMFAETGCDGILIARGCLGNPWIFREISASLKKGTILERPSRKEILQVMLEHLNAYMEFYGEKNGIVIFRKFFAWYTKGFRKIRPLREKVSRARTKDQALDIFAELRKSEEVNCAGVK